LGLWTESFLPVVLRFALCTLPFALAFAVTSAQAAVVYPLKLSSDGRYLTDQNNQPYFVVGEDAWALTYLLSNADVDVYLADRSARGFNSAWVVAADYYATTNYYGDPPFDGPDFTNENTNYWNQLDYIIQRAAAYGITLWLSTSFVDGGGYRDSLLNSSD